MTVIPLRPVEDLTLDAEFAKICEAAHRSPAGDHCPGCDHCLELIRTVATTQARLDAARSQRPVRQLFTSGASQRRLERERLDGQL